MTKTFAAQVEEFAKLTSQRQEAVFKESAQRLCDKMQTPVAKGGNMPVDTGFLRASFQTTLNAPTLGLNDNPGVPVSGGDDYALVIAGADIEDTIYGTYTARYAAAVNYGAQGMPGRQFVGLAAQQWTGIVRDVIAEFRN